MFKGIASAFLVLLLFGVALGAALFRPISADSASSAFIVPEAEGERAIGESVGLPSDLIENALAEIKQEQAALDQEKAHLALEREALEKEQERLAQERENLQMERSRLTEDLENFQAERARFWRREADLAKWEVKVRRLLYWSVAALVGSGLMAVPSTMVLVALRRQDRQMSGREAKRASVPHARQRRRATQPAGLAPTTAALTCGGNGRTRESVAHRV